MRDDEFLNSNMIRAYPFIENAQGIIPDWLVVDFRATILSGNFDPSINVVYLAWMARLEQKIRFGFRTDAEDLADQELVFELDLDAEKHVIQYVNSTPLADTKEERCGCQEELLCDPGFVLPADCGQELLCDAQFLSPCGSNLLDDCE